MLLLSLFLAGIYTLPGEAEFPVPDAARAARITRALETIRTGGGRDLDAAVRDLALCGDAALPAIARRLNEAEAAERLLLLAAASPMPRAAPLLAAARTDPHPAIRAWVEGGHHEPDPTLRGLAQGYLDLLAVAERRPYDDAVEDLMRLEDRLGQPPEGLDARRRWTKDEDPVKARDRDAQRRLATGRFARVGARALAAGELKPDLKDPVFLAYLGLLREEDPEPLSVAASALVKAGKAAEPALEELLERDNHEPRRIARLLCAIRGDGGKGLYLAFEGRRPDVQRALVELAPEVFEGADLEEVLGRAAVVADESVRTAALDALLELPAPAGKKVAGLLLDSRKFGAAEFRRAAELLARCDDLELLDRLAAAPSEEGADSSLRSAAQSALRRARGQAAEAIGRRLLASDDKGSRTLGIDLTTDRDALLAHARSEPAKDLARAALLRLLALHPDAAEQAIEVLRARAMPIDTAVAQRLAAGGRIDLLVALASTEDAALSELSGLASIEPRFEAQLLAAHDAAGEERRRATLAALVPLGTEQARVRCEALPDLALGVLRQRVEGGFPVPFPFPLRRFLDGADAARLRLLGSVAEGVPSLEPGFFFELFHAWEVLEGPGTEEGRVGEQAHLLEALAHSGDADSAKRMLGLLVEGKSREPGIVVKTLMAAAKLLPPEDLKPLVPLLKAQIPEERPRPLAEPPAPSRYRDTLLRFGFSALGYARVEAALDDLCDIVLDPTLADAAFEWKKGARSYAPLWALDALRDFPAAAVEPAFKRALARAEADGRLAAFDPDDLSDLEMHARYGFGDFWTRGRALYEVSLGLAETLERVPGSRDAGFFRMISLGGMARYPEAAAAARLEAARRRARGFGLLDGADTPERMEVRAKLYDSLAAKDSKALFAAAEAADEPFFWNLAARYLRYEATDLALAARAGEAAVRETAGLARSCRDTLAAVRDAEGRPAEALRLLDPHERVQARRPRGSLLHDMLLSDAYLQLGDEVEARRAFERAALDRRVLPYLRGNAKFARFADLARAADESFFYDVLFSFDGGE